MNSWALGREIWKTIVMAAVVLGGVCALLTGLNRVPVLLQPEISYRFRDFDNLKEAERQLGVRILTPAYFPDRFSWPPALIRIERQEPPVVVLGILRRPEHDLGLFLIQSLGKGRLEPLSIPETATVVDSREVSVNGVRATLSRTVNGGGNTWYRLEWETASRHFLLIGRDSPTDLIRMADTMGGAG